MKFLSQVVPAMLSVSGLVHALAVAPRADDEFISGLINSLKERELTSTADSFESLSRTAEGKKFFDELKGGDFTIFAPDNKAFGAYPTSMGANVIRFSTIFGKLGNGCEASSHSRRAASVQSRTPAPSTFSRKSAPRRKRAEPHDNAQVQMVVELYDAEIDKHSVVLDRPVGVAELGVPFCYRNLVIFNSSMVLTVPPPVSELLTQPLVSSAPDGFTNFPDALQRTGLARSLDNDDKLTAFVPTDDSISNWDDLSNDALASLLKNHFFFGPILFSRQFASHSEVTAQSGKVLRLSTDANGVHHVTCGATQVNILRTDVTAANGVVHVVDGPLNCD